MKNIEATNWKGTWEMEIPNLGNIFRKVGGGFI